MTGRLNLKGPEALDLFEREVDWWRWADL